MGLQSYPLSVPGALISIFHDVNSSTHTSSTITSSNVWRQVTMTASFETVRINPFYEAFVHRNAKIIQLVKEIFKNREKQQTISSKYNKDW